MAPRAEKGACTQYARNEPWKNPQETCSTRAWYSVSASPIGNGTSMTKNDFWETGLIVYHKFCKDIKIVSSTPKRSALPFRPRTARALQTKWADIQLKCNQFLREDHRASNIEFQSGGTEDDYRAAALNFYAEKYREVFDLEHYYDFLKSKPKWLLDTAQEARDRAALGKDGQPMAVNKKGGPGSRIEKRQRDADSESEEDEGPKVPGQKVSRRLLK